MNAKGSAGIWKATVRCCIVSVGVHTSNTHSLRLSGPDTAASSLGLSLGGTQVLGRLVGVAELGPAGRHDELGNVLRRLSGPSGRRENSRKLAARGERVRDRKGDLLAHEEGAEVLAGREGEGLGCKLR